MTALVLALQVQLAAASQSYTDLGSFLAALGQPRTTADFDALPSGTVLGTQIPGVDFAASGTVRLASSVGHTAHTSPNVLYTTASPFSFQFAQPTRGAGFFNTSAVDEIVTYAAWPTGGTLFQGVVPPGGFLGYISDTPIGIGSIGWLGPPNSSFSIDTFVFRAADAAPIGASRGWSLIALAVVLGAAAAYARTRLQHRRI